MKRVVLKIRTSIRAGAGTSIKPPDPQPLYGIKPAQPRFLYGIVVPIE